MPDITDLLRSGAGEPLAPLDLDRVVRRGAQRDRNRRLAQAVTGGTLAVVGVVAALAIAGGGTPKAGPQDYATQLSAKDDVVPVDPSLAPRLQPKPAASKALLPDGWSFVLIKEATADRRVVVDKVDRALTVQKQAKCGQVDETYSYAEVLSICWQNTNSLLRTASVAATATYGTVDGEPLSWDRLRALVGTATPEVSSTVWSVRVTDGVITSVTRANLY